MWHLCQHSFILSLRKRAVFGFTLRTDVLVMIQLTVSQPAPLQVWLDELQTEDPNDPQSCPIVNTVIWITSVIHIWRTALNLWDRRETKVSANKAKGHTICSNRRYLLLQGLPPLTLCTAASLCRGGHVIRSVWRHLKLLIILPDPYSSYLHVFHAVILPCWSVLRSQHLLHAIPPSWAFFHFSPIKGLFWKWSQSVNVALSPYFIVAFWKGLCVETLMCALIS